MFHTPTIRRVGTFVVAAVAVLAAAPAASAVGGAPCEQQPFQVRASVVAAPQAEIVPLPRIAIATVVRQARAEAERAVAHTVIESHGEARRALAETLRTSRGALAETLGTSRSELHGMVIDLRRELDRVDRHVAEAVDGLACTTSHSSTLARTIALLAKLPAQGVIIVKGAVVSVVKLVPRIIDAVV